MCAFLKRFCRFCHFFPIFLKNIMSVSNPVSNSPSVLQIFFPLLHFSFVKLWTNKHSNDEILLGRNNFLCHLRCVCKRERRIRNGSLATYYQFTCTGTDRTHGRTADPCRLIDFDSCTTNTQLFAFCDNTSLDDKSGWDERGKPPTWRAWTWTLS